MDDYREREITKRTVLLEATVGIGGLGLLGPLKSDLGMVQMPEQSTRFRGR